MARVVGDPPAQARTWSHYIDGRWSDAIPAETLPIVNPATERVEAYVPVATPKEAEEAIRAARSAFDDGPWPGLDRSQRSRILRQLADALWEHRDELSDIVIRQGGCTISQARGLQVYRPIQDLYQYSELAARNPVEHAEFSGGFFDSSTPWVGTSLVRREPIGVVSAITGFNYPFLLNLLKLGPVLAAGCTVVLKPSPGTCLDAAVLARIADEDTDLPKGVFNVLLGAGADVGEVMASHPLVDKVTFTGSTAVGRRIMELASQTVKSLTLELGGKSPNVIFSDADLDLALSGDCALVIRHCGQGCSQLTRVLIQSPIYDEVLERMTARARTVVVGDPMNTKIEMGPLVSAEQWERVHNYIQAGIAEGARLVYGGKRPADQPTGFFMEPTIFADVTPEMTIAQEEIFGPVVSVFRFDTEEEAIRLANDSVYGLNAAVWARDLSRALRVAGQIRSGKISVNGSGSPNADLPTGGYKQSGLGREHGLAGLLEFTELKAVRYSVP